LPIANSRASKTVITEVNTTNLVLKSKARLKKMLLDLSIENLECDGQEGAGKP
jgi:hypothetical protein